MPIKVWASGATTSGAANVASAVVTALAVAVCGGSRATDGSGVLPVLN